MTESRTVIDSQSVHKPQIVYDIGSRRYINIGKHCTLRCQFCPKHNGSWQVHDYDLELARLPSTKTIQIALGNLDSVEEVVFCGFSEPTLRLPILLSVAHWVKQQNKPVRVNTDGLGNLVHKRNILPELAACVDALSISLNAQNEAIYNRHCQPQLPGSYHSLLEFLKLAPNYIGNVTATAIDGLDGVDIPACADMTQKSNAQSRIRYLDQVG